MTDSDDHEHPPAPGAPPSMQIDAQALRGLAHPLRARLLDELTFDGPATATILGRRLGESSGSTSYHLRQLSRYGFIEADPGRSGGRERWWRIRPGGWRMRGHEFLGNPETRTVAETVLGRYYQEREARFREWTASVWRSEQSADVRRWKDASFDSVTTVRMTPEESREFGRALTDFLRAFAARYQGRTSESHPDTENVELQTNLFPHLPGGGRPASPEDPAGHRSRDPEEDAPGES
ncbi:ArsR/SmtB family transcription factor [Nocardiopsis tropica]|uniref:Helix-turn-helix domain-containing protein n=1 Tax=Nocardiopsis tropica TaxID=109330 RepID=A0ABU7KQU2_9ACTN|nr:helix-turn-helix domain-containing protein [Nocardiopsis umidischolae]MEE2051042.1 helix-turn-helix domain-containing protein [Nocardiopsis umidischolae]